MCRYGKIAVIGAGHVGSHCAMAFALRGICGEIVLIDKDRQKARSQAMDIADALSFPPVKIIVTDGDYDDCADADIIIIAVGEPRLPGQTRLDLLGNSVKMLSGLVSELNKISIKGIVITITNPADIVADYVRRGLKMDRSRVFGTGTLLDTARLMRVLSEKTGFSSDSILAYSMGEHGDSSMVPFSQVRIGGLPFFDFLGINKFQILELTRERGMKIINGKNSTEFGIGQVVSALCACILMDEKKVMPLSVLLQGEYGQEGVHCGVPCLVGKNGIEAVIDLQLNEEEHLQMDKSCEIIREHIAKAQMIAPLN